MQISKKIFFSVLCLIVFSGCAELQKKYNTPPKIVKKDTSLLKQQRKCEKYIETMTYASSYILEEFEKGYFLEKNTQGAKAQLFLIKNKSKSIFAQNINSANTLYNLKYQIAKKSKCKLTQFKIAPLIQIGNKIKKLDKSQ